MNPFENDKVREAYAQIETEWIGSNGNAGAEFSTLHHSFANEPGRMTIGITNDGLMNGKNGISHALNVLLCTVNRNGDDEKKPFAFAFEKILGNGSFGVVVQIRQLPNGPLLAIKKVFQDPNYQNRELTIMRTVSHDNIVGMMGYFYSRNGSDSWLNLVLEFVPETIFKVVKETTKKTGNGIRRPERVRKWANGIFRALEYLHSIGICHRDIKPQNLLVEPATDIIKLCDFGSAKRLVEGEPNVSYICSRFYRAPEIVLGATRYTSAIDIWSAGCVLGEVVLGKPLFSGKNTVEQFMEIAKTIGTPNPQELVAMNVNLKEYQFSQIAGEKTRSLRSLFGSIFEDPHENARFLDLMKAIFVFDPNKRITASGALQHPFLSDKIV